MCDPKRIERITNLLQHGWEQVPDWTFGELIDNIIFYIGCRDLSGIEDDVLEKKLIDFVNQETIKKVGISEDALKYLDEIAKRIEERKKKQAPEDAVIDADAIPEADKKEYVNIRVKFRETDANGWIEIYDALDTLKWYSSEFHIEGNEDLVELLTDDGE